jgi:hypothetical protein
MPYNFDELILAEVRFWQDGNKGTVERPLPIVKSLNQCECGKHPRQLFTFLTEEETLRFSNTKKAWVQMRATPRDGNTFGCLETPIPVYPYNGDEPLGDVVFPTPDENDVVFLDGGRITG